MTNKEEEETKNLELYASLYVNDENAMINHIVLPEMSSQI